MKVVGNASNALVLALVVPMLACTWAPLTPEGRSVRIVRATEVTQCQKVGTATSNTSDRALIFARNDWKIREEVEFLARNEAAKLGGDAIVPMGPLTDGRQSFDVYRCGKP